MNYTVDFLIQNYEIPASVEINLEQDEKVLEVLESIIITINKYPEYLSYITLLNIFYDYLRKGLFKEAQYFISYNHSCVQLLKIFFPLNELSQFFSFCVQKKLTFLVNALWNQGHLLSSYYCGRAIPEQFTNQSGMFEYKILQIKFEEVVKNFQLVMANEYFSIAASMLQSTPKLKSFIQDFVNQKQASKVLNETLISTSSNVIDFSLIENFKRLLFLGMHSEVSLVWKRYTQYFALYFSGKSIEVKITDKDNITQIKAISIKLPELILVFQHALKIGESEIVKFIWNNNLSLPVYYSRKKIEYNSENELGELETTTLQISMEELIRDFKMALFIGNKYIVDSIWNNNKQLVEYFKGNEIQDLVLNAYKIQETHIWRISTYDLITNFKYALVISNIDIIQAMWGQDGSRLRDVVKNFNDTQLTEILNKVLSSNNTVTKNFLEVFLQSIENKSVLQKCLELKKTRKPNPQNQKQIELLSARIDEIEIDLLAKDSEIQQALDELFTLDNMIYSKPSALVSNSVFLADPPSIKKRDRQEFDENINFNAPNKK